MRETISGISSHLSLLIRRKKISTRLVVGFILIAFIPVLAVGSVSYASGSRAVYNKMSRSIAQIMEEIGVNLGYQLQAIINDGTEIAYSELAQSALIDYAKMNGQEKNNMETMLSAYINKKYVFVDRVAEITLYTTHMGRVNAYGPSDIRFVPKKNNLDTLIRRARDLDGKCLWVAAGPEYEQGLASKVLKDRQSIVLARAVKSLRDGAQIGYIIMRIDARQFHNVYANIDIGTGTRMFIVNSENKVISSSGPYARFAAQYPDPMLLRHIAASGKKSFDYHDGDHSCLATFSAVEQADWYIVALVEFSYLYSESRDLLWIILAIGALCLFFALCVSYAVYSSIMTPVNQLVFGIKSFKNGQMDITINDSGNDEISELNQRFNEMAANTRLLIENIKENELQKRELEIRALQAQINPHFMANALNTVTYIASLKKQTNIVKIIDSILTLMNACMRNDSSLASVEEEITFLKSYMTIQETRLFGGFSVQYSIDPAIYPLLIPRFLLQPVVENALIHGIEPSGKSGVIVLKGYRLDKRLHFSVTDNGGGMSRELIDQLLRADSSQDRERLSGIGISNVQNRIKLLYGPEFGLEINSVEGVFTTVDIYLPVITDNGKAE
jgi:two-component system, sensor histidine kinase YesM